MIIVRLLGGLGNQMFQYAAGRALAVKHGVPLKLDISAFQQYPLRSYRLHQFHIEAALADDAEVARVRRTDLRGLRRRLWLAFDRRRPYFRRATVREPHFHFDPNLARARTSAYLVGFWQSENYFASIRDLIRTELTVIGEPDAANQQLLEHIESTESISLHLRRGDYVTSAHNQRLHGSCSIKYYEEALEQILSGLTKPHVFVFSDDIPWARVHLPTHCPTTFVDHNGVHRDHEDIRLMRRCRHHIIANSTFSWWGAWLASGPAQRVIAPRRWFNDPSLDTGDVIPPSWTRL